MARLLNSGQCGIARGGGPQTPHPRRSRRELGKIHIRICRRRPRRVASPEERRKENPLDAQRVHRSEHQPRLLKRALAIEPPPHHTVRDPRGVQRQLLLDAMPVARCEREATAVQAGPVLVARRQVRIELSLTTLSPPEARRKSVRSIANGTAAGLCAPIEP